MDGKMYADKETYVNGLNNALEAMQDFDYIKYARTGVEEYIKIADKLGGYVFIDVTGNEKSDILKDVARVVLNEELDGKQFPRGIINDKVKLRQIAPLFR